MSTNTNVVELELYIIRHGQTYGNLGIERSGEPFIDLADPKLTEKGEKQAQLVGERFSHYEFDAVYSSGLRRALSTASEIVNQQPENGAHELKVLPKLTECGAGDDYDGMKFCDIKKMYPWTVPAEGISENDLMIYRTRGWDDTMQDKRAKEVIDYLRNIYNHGEKVAVVAHAAFNTFLTHAALGIDPTKVIFDPHFLNTGVTKIVFFKKGTGRYDLDVQLVYLNDLSHMYTTYPELGLYQDYN